MTEVERVWRAHHDHARTVLDSRWHPGRARVRVRLVVTPRQ